MRPVAARGAQVVAAEVEAVVREQRLGARRRRARPTRARRTAASSRSASPRSCTSCSSAPRSGSAVAVAKLQHREGAGAADQLLQRGELAHRGGEPGAVELGDLAGVLGGERVGAALRVVEQRLHARGAVAGAVEQRFQIPGDPLDARDRRLRARPCRERLRRAQPVQHEREVAAATRRASGMRPHHGARAAHHHRDVVRRRVGAHPALRLRARHQRRRSSAARPASSTTRALVA